MSIPLYEINPFLRCAPLTQYKSPYNPVRVSDCRLFYITAGHGELIMKNQHYELVPHSLFYCCAGSEYNIIAPEGVSPICLNFDLTQAYNHQKETFPRQKITDQETPVRIPVCYDEILDSPFLNDHFYLKDAKQFFHLVQRIQETFLENAPYAPGICSGLLKELLLELHRTPKTTAPSKIDLVMKFIETNYASDISNQTLAELVGYHEYHLNRLFLSHTGTNLHSYLLKVRMNRASLLILNTDLPLKAIPEKCGFHSYHHFSAYFKQMFGCSPAQYRKNMQESI